MKFKTLVLMLALAVASWAQTATPNSTAAPQPNGPNDKANCSCCDKTAATDSKDTHSCCAKHSKKAKDLASSCTRNGENCCGDKDVKSSAQSDKAMKCGSDCKEKDAKSCCNSAETACGKDCCSNKNQKTAKNCCHEAVQS